VRSIKEQDALATKGRRETAIQLIRFLCNIQHLVHGGVFLQLGKKFVHVHKALQFRDADFTTMPSEVNILKIGMNTLTDQTNVLQPIRENFMNLVHRCKQMKFLHAVDQ